MKARRLARAFCAVYQHVRNPPSYCYRPSRRATEPCQRHGMSQHVVEYAARCLASQYSFRAACASGDHDLMRKRAEALLAYA